MVRQRQGSPRRSTYPIGVVSRRTGLTPATLRVWERRYRAVEPQRLPSGHRLYTEKEIERLLLLRRSLAGGWRIGQVARLDTAELRALTKEAGEPERPKPEDGPAKLRRDFLDAVERLDSDRMARLLDDASIELSRTRLFDLFLGPLLHEIGEQWAAGSLRPAHEHLATSTIRHWLEGLRPSIGPPSPAAHLLVATPRGQLHELGALLVVLCAEEVGWRATYLGPDLPAEEIALAAKELSVDAVALSVLHRAPRLDRELARLRDQVGAELPIVVGGPGAAAGAAALGGLGVVVGGSWSDLRGELQRLQLDEAQAQGV